MHCAVGKILTFDLESFLWKGGDGSGALSSLTFMMPDRNMPRAKANFTEV
jgi:hypothetical protein